MIKLYTGSYYFVVFMDGEGVSFRFLDEADGMRIQLPGGETKCLNDLLIQHGGLRSLTLLHCP